MDKEQIEKRHMEHFLRLQFPTGALATPLPAPEPDFLIQTDLGLIGIEHTRLIRKKDSSKIDPMAHYMTANKIMTAAEMLFNQSNQVCLMVHVDFRCDYGLAITDPIQLYKKDIQPLSTFIADFVTQHLSTVLTLPSHQPLDFETYNWNTLERILPDNINNITIYNLSQLTQSCWSAYQSAIVPGIFSSEEWKDVFIKKNTKPINYQNVYAQLWLLIVQDSMDMTAYFHFDDQHEPEVITPFDRVFILLRAENEIVELKNVKKS